MKREIKFRAWDKAKHRMLGVDQLAFGPNGELVSIYSDGPDFSNDSEALMGDKPDLNEAVLMQYAGRKDKNGREIYEGDIVKNEYGKVMEVKYDPRSAAFGVGGYYFGTIGSGKILEVIGNIFEDKQLLEAKQ
ncbi:YopX family protein [Lacticaseibacillus paracasei]|uniref:YopX family protein n=1 Tax=Lacticaseibacillus paracasei TaxID=1597 RepID=UPI00336B75B9